MSYSPKTMPAVYAGGHVKRMHTRITLTEQTVAQHSYGVAWWCWVLTGGTATANLLMSALAHDVPEHKTGDIPANVKHTLLDQPALQTMETHLYNDANIPVFELDAYEARILKLADYADLLAYCRLELSLGNTTPSLKEMYANVKRNMVVMLKNDSATFSFIQETLENTYGALPK